MDRTGHGSKYRTGSLVFPSLRGEFVRKRRYGSPERNGRGGRLSHSDVSAFKSSLNATGSLRDRDRPSVLQPAQEWARISAGMLRDWAGEMETSYRLIFSGLSAVLGPVETGHSRLDYVLLQFFQSHRLLFMGES